jgi:hypothetical protein
MAELARDYHNDLQQDATESDLERKDTNIAEVLASMPPPPSVPSMADLEKSLTEDDVRESMKDSASGKAPGVNGIPTELWTRLDSIYQAEVKKQPDPQNPIIKFNVVKMLTAVYNDIENNGVEEGSDFARGWMCPIFKKGDVTDIANHRPITVLNSDYKIFTKALNKKLAHVAPLIVHKDQAGFMKGRKMADQIYLPLVLVEYAE